jgi:hypothetical protein
VLVNIFIPGATSSTWNAELGGLGAANDRKIEWEKSDEIAQELSEKSRIAVMTHTISLVLITYC